MAEFEVFVQVHAVGLVAALGRNYKDGDLLGGLVTGVEPAQVATYWGKGVDKQVDADRAKRLGVNLAFEIGKSWRLKPADSFICSTQSAPYVYDVVLTPSASRLRDVVTNDGRVKFYSCCEMLICSPEAYDQCIYDHIELNPNVGEKNCIGGFNSVAKHACQRKENSGSCKGGWSEWSKCTDNQQVREYIVQRIQIPGFPKCHHVHGTIETQGC